ncbi:hypothetical protein B0H14DRAFT_2612296 [Mycena olivaceomarginata]|nr:hypothetical protein B0H14DRAFT_2612296 [Mycena olivaceomarginata]
MFSHRDFKGSRPGRDPFVVQTNNRLDLHTGGQLQSRRIRVTTSQLQTRARLPLSHLGLSRAFTVPAPPSPSQSAIAREFTPSCASTSNSGPFEFEDQPGMSDDPGDNDDDMEGIETEAESRHQFAPVVCSTGRSYHPMFITTQRNPFQVAIQQPDSLVPSFNPTADRGDKVPMGWRAEFAVQTRSDEDRTQGLEDQGRWVDIIVVQPKLHV